MNQQKKFVLVVDDEELMREIICRQLKKLGNDVIEAKSAENALEILECNPHVFDIVVTDYKMGGMTGADLIRQIKKRNFKVQKFIMISSMVGMSEDIESLQADYENLQTICKPFDNKDLVEALLNSLG